jgi:NhaA family Na+:H+ antiporter
MQNGVYMIRRFLQMESASGMVLFVVAIVAMIWANSPLNTLHQQFINKFLFIINDGLMAIFFLLVGLELKRNYLEGQLSRLSEVILPFFAALGGMLVPVIIYCWINKGQPETLRGWATPVATDIAFALGVLSLFGKRVPNALKLFLLALAIFDDIGAIIIISLFYSTGIAWSFLFLAFIFTGVLLLLNHKAVSSLTVYLCGGLCLWLCLFYAGIHPTIAGVLLAFTIPTKKDLHLSPLHRLENNLHFWVAFIIMPLFALTNAGFSLQGLTFTDLLQKVVLGITLGLFLGKQIGVFLFSWLIIKLKFAKLPVHCSWLGLYGISLLCGIGFTMSLFLGTLSFPNDADYLAQVRLGVFMGSFLSGLLGSIILFVVFRERR